MKIYKLTITLRSGFTYQIPVRNVQYVVKHLLESPTVYKINITENKFRDHLTNRI